MAWFDVDIFKKCVVLDLHDYSHRTAIMLAREKIKEAYGHGFKYVKLIHGASLKKKGDGGSIKFAIREMLRCGEINNWVEDKDSENHRIRDGSIILALRKNPAPTGGEWRDVPRCDY